jgi:MYXO-CTERM domain-containing protein
MGVAVALATAALARDAHALTFMIDNVDTAGQGFNDPTAATPVGGNSGTTLGQQRLNVFQRAGQIWGAALGGTVPIVVQASFAPLDCSNGNIVLGQAGFVTAVPGMGATANVYVPTPLANQLYGYDVDTRNPDIQAMFNGGLNACSKGQQDWYYGFDGQAGDNIDLLGVVLHEFGHGLGFSSMIDPSNGQVQTALIDSFSTHIYDDTAGQSWAQMSAAQRIASAENARQLVWNGTNVSRQAAELLVAGFPLIQTQPALGGLTGHLGEAEFGGYLSGLSSKMASGRIFGTQPNTNCNVTGTGASGAIVVVPYTGCPSINQAASAQQAGAVAIMVTDPQGTDPPFTAGVVPSDRSRFTVTIPVLSISQADWSLLTTASSGTTATLTADTTRRVGADAQGRPYLFASNPQLPGSTLDHWDELERPDLLMEPEAAADPVHDIRMELALFRDIGWPTICGNGNVDPGEACDLGAQNGASGSACHSDCTAVTAGGTGGAGGGAGGASGSGGISGGGSGGAKGTGGVSGGGGVTGGGGAKGTGGASGSGGVSGGGGTTGGSGGVSGAPGGSGGATAGVGGHSGGGGAGTGGATGAGGALAGDASTSTDATTEKPPSSGCSCRMDGGGSRGERVLPSVAWAGLVIAIAGLRRRRRR